MQEDGCTFNIIQTLNCGQQKLYSTVNCNFETMSQEALQNSATCHITAKKTFLD